ncbi:hypothetical protein AB0G15_34490 [Streptosporangium sp. NPDC023825]|uniref:hypothetical protein n=1 Tax=Streptosporangium sp. NPDC023825 TaxID=3154909 RepID=UPI0034202ADA
MTNIDPAMAQEVAFVRCASCWEPMRNRPSEYGAPAHRAAVDIVENASWSDVARLLLLTGSIRQGARVGRYRPGLHLHRRNRVYLWHESYRHSGMVRVGSRCQVQPGDEPERLPLPVTIESDAKRPWNDPYAATQKPT